MSRSKRLKKSHKLQVWITPEVYEKFWKISEKESRNIAELVREFIAEGIKKKEFSGEC